jgi:redox-sensitive bicupin YhaK (pirin superfamily)
VLSGKPLKEPIWWHGPIVMNSREEIMEAMNDLNNGTFIREKNPVFVD